MGHKKSKAKAEAKAAKTAKAVKEPEALQVSAKEPQKKGVCGGSWFGPKIVLPEELPYCKTCKQVYGENERELLPEQETELKWRVFNDKLDDDGEWAKTPATWECYYCWDDRRYNEPPNTTQEMVIKSHKTNPQKKE